MLRVLGCITDQHDIRLVILAGIICLFASYSAFNLMTRARVPEKWGRRAWLLAAAAVTGGGVWSTHFVAELAFRPGLPVGYDLGLTALSVVIAVAVSAVGLFLALRPRGAAVGGGVVGVAIVAMHYTGMAAMRLPAVAHWDVDYVAASIVIAVAGSSLAMAMARRREDFRGRLQATGILVLAICGLHFTAMTAVTFSPDPTVTILDQSIAPEWLAIAIAAVTLLIVGLGLAGSIVDQHLAQRSIREAARLRLHVIELENTKRELTKALEVVAAANESKSQFLAHMSHELRTPLNAIIGFSEILKSELVGPIGNDQYLGYAVDIYNSGTHLLSLINDILDITKLDAIGDSELHDESIDLRKLVAECLFMMGPQAAKAKVRLNSTFDIELPSLRADSRRLRQILINLLSNGIKFTPEDGEVQVSVYRSVEGLKIAVADTGIGMAPHEIPKALELFGQIDSALARKYDGTGLGLPLTKRLVELHSARLTIDSKLAKGTTVTVLFPASRVQTDRQAA